MNKWFVIHDLIAYNQHCDMIGNPLKTSDIKEPKFSKFAELQKKDFVVYYATKDRVVVGIFQVVSDMEYLPNDSYWKEMMIYNIRPVELPVCGYYLDFKKLVVDPEVQFDMFPRKKHWGSYLQGRTCILLTQQDYLTIKDALSKNRYLKKASKCTRVNGFSLR